MLIEELFPPRLIVTNVQYRNVAVPGPHLFYAMVRTALPDAEDVLFRLMVGPCFTDHYAIFRTPEIRVAIPAVQRLAVEDLLKPGLLERLNLLCVRECDC